MEKTQKHMPENDLDYHQLINYMKELKMFFHKKHSTIFKFGKIYKGNPNFSYFSLTTDELKNEKLKFVIFLNHIELCFSICLSGQNKSIRKKYWNILKTNNSLVEYQLAESIDNSLSIIEKTTVKKADFSDKKSLTEQINNESLQFINDIKILLNKMTNY